MNILPLDIIKLILNHDTLTYYKIFFKFVCKKWYNIFKNYLFSNKQDIINNITKDGNLYLLKILIIKLKYPYKNIHLIASTFGHIHILNYLYNIDNSIFNWLTCYGAASGGYLNILEWLVKKGIPITLNVFEIAAYKGHYHIIKWGIEHNYQINNSIYVSAAESGNLELIKWLKENKIPSNNPKIFTKAIINGNLKLINWLYLNNFPIDKYACTAAAIKNNIELLKLLKNKNIPWDSNVAVETINNDNYECLKYCIENGIELTNNLIENIVERSSINCLKYIKIKSLDMYNLAIRLTIKKEKIMFLDLIKKNIDYFPDEMCKFSSINNCYKSLQWFSINNCDCLGTYH